MGSSLVLTGGAAVAKTLKETITQTAHGFTVGDVLRWDASAATPKYVLAQADSATNAEVAGVVSARADANTFDITYSGYIDVPQFSGVSLPVMFLSSVAGGSLSATPPSAVGTVVKPVLTRNTNGSGHLVMNYLGTQIGGSSTIAVDEIQPVGTIMPFAGNAIPDTWLECNGASYSVGSYPELYSKLCYTTNARAPMYGYAVEITLSSGSATLWNNIQVGDAIITNSTATAPTFQSYEIIGRVLSKTASLSGLYPLTIQIFPNYSPTNKNFVYPDKIPLASTGQVKAYSTVFSGAMSDPYYGVATGTDRSPSGPGTINTVAIVSFNVPDLRGRVGVGTLSAGLGEWESDALISAISGNYPSGSFGGEEQHTLTVAEMPSHSHPQNATETSGYYYWVSDEALAANNQGESVNVSPSTAWEFSRVSNVAAQGGNSSHNNMPPYLAVRHIIKAKPYTRAAIVDGIDLPYNSLLIRDLRSRNVGGSNGDLVFHTNTAGDSGNGTERMRLTTDGRLSIGINSSVTNPNPLLLFGSQFSSGYPVNAFFMDTDAPAIGKGGGLAFGGKPSSASDPTSTSGRAGYGSIGAYKENATDGDYSGYLSITTRASGSASFTERIRISSTGNVGIATTVPSTALTVDGIIQGGNASAVGGSIILVGGNPDVGSYNYPQVLNLVGSEFSSGRTVITYGLKPKSGDYGFLNTHSASEINRAALLIGGMGREGSSNAGGIAVYGQRSKSQGTLDADMDSSVNLILRADTSQLWYKGASTFLDGHVTGNSSSNVPLYIRYKASSIAGTFVVFQASTSIANDTYINSNYSSGDNVGSIVCDSSGVMTYNTFCGSHWSSTVDESTDILPGTVMESVSELHGNHLPKAKISDGVDSESVYGVFFGKNENGGISVASLGAYFVRIAAGTQVSVGDLLVSDGTGCAVPQQDDVVRSKTIGKVTSTTKLQEYSDGSYTVPSVLYCG